MTRPRPPKQLLDPPGSPLFVPAPELVAWLRKTFIAEDGPLTNPDHAHLVQAEIGALWTNEPARDHQLAVAGMAEIPVFRGKRWVKARQEQQMLDWFGLVPDFVITLFAPYAHFAPDDTFCALVEHELYHCGIQLDRWGVERFRRDGTPVWAIRGHDVEEFVGVVRRYGAHASAGETAALVEAAKGQPEVAEVQLQAACGTCRRAA